MFEMHSLMGSESSSVDLAFLGTEALNKLVTFAYTGIISYDIKTIEPLVQAAGYLQVQEITDECDEQLAKIVTKDNSVKWYVFGRQYSLQSVVKIAEKLILKHFEQVIRCSDFMDMQAEDIIHFMNNHSLNIASEDVVVDAIASWIAHDGVYRIAASHEMLECVRLDLCSTEFLNSILDQTKYDHVVSMSFRNRVRNVLRRRSGTSRRVTMVKSNPPRYSYTSKKLLLVGSKVTDDEKKGENVRDCMYWQRSEQQWTKFTELPTHFSRCRQWKVYATNNLLFVSGGFTKDTESNSILGCKEAWMYYKKKWIQLPNMTQGRWSHGVIAAKGLLFSFGGKSHKENTYTSHLKHNEYMHLDYYFNEYDHPPLCWIFTTSMKFKFYDPILTTDSKEENIYILGMNGCPTRFVRHTYAYNIHKRGLTPKACIPEDAMGAAAVNVGEDMYVVGGESGVCLQYTPALDTWCKLTSCKAPRLLSSAVYLDDKIVVANRQSRSRIEVAEAEEYERQNNTWSPSDLRPPAAFNYGLGAVFNVDMDV